MKMKSIVTFIAGFVVGTVLLYGWGQLFNKQDTADSLKAATQDVEQFEVDAGASVEVEADNAEDVTIGASSTEAIIVESQPASDTVSLNMVNLQAGESGGWVVIHEIKDGMMANALGAARRDSGEYADIKVYLLRSTVQGGTYAVVLYNDNGDKQFSIKTDNPLTDSNGKYVMSTFVAQ